MSDAASEKTGTEKKVVNLALQGGGAHGAFTWGVLDALSEDGRLKVEGISGTSAGAMNGAAYSFGYEQGGPAGARGMLDAFWNRVGKDAAWGIEMPSALKVWMHGTGPGFGLDHSPLYLGFDVMSRFLSPYQFNPFNLNPLRRVVEDTINFQRLILCQRTKLFVSATNVRTGKIKVFRTSEITPDVLLASACLPYLFQTVEIDGEAYWDGGYMGNPAIYPLIYNCESPDVIVVQINPMRRNEVPTNAREILNRVTEISFNSSMMREMRAIAFVTRLIDEGSVTNPRYKRLNMHFIAAEEEMAALGSSSKYNTDRGFLDHLKALGRETAKTWLDANYAKIGKESSIDLEEMFL